MRLKISWQNVQKGMTNSSITSTKYQMGLEQVNKRLETTEKRINDLNQKIGEKREFNADLESKRYYFDKNICIEVAYFQ